MHPCPQRPRRCHRYRAAPARGAAATRPSGSGRCCRYRRRAPSFPERPPDVVPGDRTLAHERCFAPLNSTTVDGSDGGSVPPSRTSRSSAATAAAKVEIDGARILGRHASGPVGRGGGQGLIQGLDQRPCAGVGTLADRDSTRRTAEFLGKPTRSAPAAPGSAVPATTCRPDEAPSPGNSSPHSSAIFRPATSTRNGLPASLPFTRRRAAERCRGDPAPQSIHGFSRVGDHPVGQQVLRPPSAGRRRSRLRCRMPGSRAPGREALGQLKILGGGDLQVSGRSRHQRHRVAGRSTSAASSVAIPPRSRARR